MRNDDITASRGALLAPLILSLVLSACTIPERLFAVPQSLTTDAQVSAGSNIRFWINEDPEPLAREGLESVRRERAYLARTGHTGPLPPADFLAVSGGGDNGAFGAGLLVGWTAHGDRPVFKGVTGVSTGALIAPLAFLGPDHDDELRRAYTEISKTDMFRKRSLLAAILNDGMVDATPFHMLVESFVTPELLARIAEEYAKGRLLFVATTDLDARQPVIWNMTAIAASGDPGALDLFRKVLIASASVPGVFPPVMIEVAANGRTYQEMHVDGGTMAQVFLYPPYFRLAEETARQGIERERHFYLIRNARLDPDWASVDRRTVDIAGRAISALIHSQGLGDLYRLYLTARRDGIDYNLAYIGSDFDAPYPGEFDTGYMRALFDHGYRLGRAGYPWQKHPPGYVASDVMPPLARAAAGRCRASATC